MQTDIKSTTQPMTALRDLVCVIGVLVIIKELLLRHETFSDFKHFGCRLRIKSGRMFIKQQELRAHKRRHEQRKRLALTPVEGELQSVAFVMP